MPGIVHIIHIYDSEEVYQQRSVGCILSHSSALLLHLGKNIHFFFTFILHFWDLNCLLLVNQTIVLLHIA